MTKGIQTWNKFINKLTAVEERIPEGHDYVIPKNMRN